MEGTIGEVRMFAGTFAPMDWAICSGQTLLISQNTALFAIIGTYYGGDGMSTYKLPDLQGRTIVGAGHGLGLTAYNLGNAAGTEKVVISQSEMAAHTHTPLYQQTASGTATVTVKASLIDQSAQPSPSGNFLGAPNNVGELMYGLPAAPVQAVPMASGTLKVTGVTGPQVTGLTVSSVGSSPAVGHENRQPSLALNYVICMLGLFPARD